jgi:hypothetical protein
LLVGALAAGLLFGSFSANVLGVAEPSWFAGFQEDTAALILGRMAKSRQDGLLSGGAFNGWGSADASAPGGRGEWLGGAAVGFQRRAYLGEARVGAWQPYFSQPGGQGLIFSAIDRRLPLAPASRLRFLHHLNCAYSALVLAGLVMWLHRELGGAAALAGLASMLLSPWLVVFGRSLWWCLWAFYLPMVALLWILRWQRASPTRRALPCALMVFLGLLLKDFFNGFEYITAAVVMALVPFVYEGTLERWRGGAFARLAAASAGAAAALAVALLALAAQVAAVKGGARAGFDHLVYSFQKRTHADPTGLPAAYRKSLEAPTRTVVRTYLDGACFDAGRWPWLAKAAKAARLPARVTYAFLAWLFLGASALALLPRGRWRARGRWRPALALVAATWFSALAPLSWFAGFKAHSYIHTHMNFVAWHMPFTILGFATCGLALRGLFLQRPNEVAPT